MALGSDVMDVALEGYIQLKVSGRDNGLENALRNELGAHWKKGRRPQRPGCGSGVNLSHPPRLHALAAFGRRVSQWQSE